jgi:hypothetical protein
MVRNDSHSRPIAAAEGTGTASRSLGERSWTSAGTSGHKRRSHEWPGEGALPPCGSGVSVSLQNPLAAQSTKRQRGEHE